MTFVRALAVVPVLLLVVVPTVSTDPSTALRPAPREADRAAFEHEDVPVIAAGTVPTVDPASAEDVLFGATPDEARVARAACPSGPPRVRCLVAARYEDDDARALALDLWERQGTVAGLEMPMLFDGGYRGTIRLVPALPVGRSRRHLAWVHDGLVAIDTLLARLREGAPRPLTYDVRGLSLRFFRSVGRTTPSAYALDRTVAYNLAGSLHRSAEAVRDTLAHEIFHLHDGALGTWSARVLGPDYDAILARCGARSACLAPYAPNRTKVRGGTYYAFHRDNGVPEYAAELALRYLREQRAAVDGARSSEPPFKCGPPENAAAWRALVDTFFGGVDRVPSCPVSASGAPTDP